MTEDMTGFLFENFEKIAEAPGGVQRLRELILQLAVTGRLGTGVERDEPAKQLLNRICSALYQSKSQKKGYATATPDNTVDKPFIIPNSWLWVFLGNISQIIEYGSSTKAHTDHRCIPIIRMNNLVNGKIDYYNLKYVDPDIEELPKLFLLKGDLLFNRTNSFELVGKTSLFERESSYYTFASYLIRIRLFVELLPEYVNLAMNSDYFRKTQIEPKIVQQCGQANFNGSKLRETLIPLPPLAEQQRIVEKVDTLMALCDDLEAKQTQKHTHLIKLGTGSLTALQQSETPGGLVQCWEHLQTHFGLIFDCVENVEALRQTILQLAVTGRLGTGDERDEPASNFFYELKLEREKRGIQVPISSISNTERFCNSPSNWTWIRLKDLGSMCGGMTPSSINPRYWDGDIIWVTSKDMKSRYILDSQLKITDDALVENRLKLIPEFSLLIVARSGILKRTIPVAVLKKEGTINQDLKALTPYISSMTGYLYLLIKGHEQYILNSLVKGGMTVQSLRYKEFEEQPYPIPPLAEQHRIVEKVDTLMTLCDELEQNISHRSNTSVSLSNATIQRITGLT